MTDEKRDDWGDDGGLASRLDAYAAARLRVDPESTARVRARVMAEARRAADRTSAPTAPAPVAARSRGIPALAALRAPLRSLLLATGALAIGLALVGGALAGSGPGGPVYGARLWVEAITLPADPAARLDAQVGRLEARLGEAERAGAEGNGAAVTAALDAYRAIADAAAGDAGVEVSLREHIAAQLGRHVAVLVALAAEVPAPAAEAIRAAVERTEVRIQEILATPPDKPVTPGRPADPGKPAATPETVPAATPAKSPPGRPKATPGPAATPKPVKSPGPGKTPRPEKSPGPGKSPGPANSAPGQVERASPAP